MARYEPEGLHTSTESPILEAYIAQELRRIAEAFLGVEEIILPVLNVEPKKPRNGQVILVDGTDFDPGSGAGFYGRSAGAWVKLG